jgi:hypothetical protein
MNVAMNNVIGNINFWLKFMYLKTVRAEMIK